MIQAALVLAALGGSPHEVVPGSEVALDMGLLSPKQAVVVEVSVRSGRTALWELPECDVSCPSCVEVLEWPRLLQPNETGVIRLRITPGDDPGVHAWGVACHGAAAPLRVRCRGIVRGLAVSPQAIRFGDCPVGTHCERSVEIRWFGQGTMEDVRWRGEDPMVRAVCTASEAPGLNDAWQTWSVRLSGAAPGEVDAVLGVKAVIKRQDGTRQIERQRVRVSGRVVESGIRVLPRSIFFGTVRPGDRCEASILVYGIDGDVEVEAGGIAGLSGSSSAHQGVTQVRVVFEPDVEVDGLLRGQVALRRVGSSEVCVTVPVVVFVKTES